MSIRTRSSFALAGIVFFVAVAAHAAPDDMTLYRERFKQGLGRYQAGAVAEAIQYWEPIYRELGAERGWRLAFNLARAYDRLGDITRAVDRYEAFLAQVAARPDAKAEELIAREEVEARERLAEIAATKARIVIRAGPTPMAVKIDGDEPRISGFTAYVAPGRHVVIFDPGSAREARVAIEIGAGEAKPVELPRTEAEPPKVAEPPPTPPRLEPSTPPATRKTVEDPFPAPLLWVAAGATVVSTIVPILTYQSAVDFRDSPQNHLSADATRTAQNSRIESDYDAHKTTYYLTLAIPITLAIGTGALAAWYFLGKREREVPVVAVTPNGGYAGLERRF